VSLCLLLFIGFLTTLKYQCGQSLSGSKFETRSFRKRYGNQYSATFSKPSAQPLLCKWSEQCPFY